MLLSDTLNISNIIRFIKTNQILSYETNMQILSYVECETREWKMALAEVVNMIKIVDQNDKWLDLDQMDIQEVYILIIELHAYRNWKCFAHYYFEENLSIFS